MPRIADSSQRQWLPLGSACRMLEVNQATLRTWADRGLIRVYRTPGGHRRFSWDGVQALLASPPDTSRGRQEREFGELALRRIRRRLHGRSMEGEHWYERIDGESRRRMGLFGRRLLTLVTDYLNRRQRRSELLEEARLVGEEYGAQMGHLGLCLEDVMRAFVFFRNSLMDCLEEPRTPGVSWQQVNLVTDEVLLALARAYEGSLAAGARKAASLAEVKKPP